MGKKLLNIYLFDEDKFKKEHLEWNNDKKLFNPIDRSFTWWYYKKQIETSKYRKFEYIDNQFQTFFVEIDNDYLWCGYVFYKHNPFPENFDNGTYYSWKSVKLYEKTYNKHYYPIKTGSFQQKLLSDFNKMINRDLKLNEIGI